MIKIQNAGIMLIVNKRNEILAVSRKDDKTKFCLPGGKPEPTDLSIKETAIRETEEETGLIVKKCKLIYQNTNYDNNTYFNTTTFLAEEWTGAIHTDENIIIKWLTPEELTSETSGAYPEYNTNVVKAYNALQILF